MAIVAHVRDVDYGLSELKFITWLACTHCYTVWVASPEIQNTCKINVKWEFCRHKTSLMVITLAPPTEKKPICNVDVPHVSNGVETMEWLQNQILQSIIWNQTLVRSNLLLLRLFKFVSDWLQRYIGLIALGVGEANPGHL